MYSGVVAKPKALPEYIAWLHTRPCLVAGNAFSPCGGSITAHHVRPMGCPRNDRLAVSLCQHHHQWEYGPDAVHRLGRRGFAEKFGIRFEDEIARLNAAWRSVK